MRSRRLLELGGAKVTELEALIAQAEQYAWGPADIIADISILHSRLKDAKQWVAQVFSHHGLPSGVATHLVRSAIAREQLQKPRACSLAMLYPGMQRSVRRFIA